MKTNKKSVLLRNLFICAVLLGSSLLAFRIMSPYFKVSFLIVDEAFYAEVANQMIDGDFFYRNNKPPGIYFIYSGIFLLFGKNNIYAMHVSAFISLILTGLCLYFLVSYLKNRFAGTLSAITYMLLPSFSISPSNFYAANTEIFMMLPFTLSILFFIKAGEKKSYLFISGILCAVSLLFKQQGLLLIPFFTAFIFLNHFSLKTDILTWKLKKLVYIICGVLAVFIPVVLLFWHKGAFRDFFYNVFWVNRLYFGNISFITGLIRGYLKIKNTYFNYIILIHTAVLIQIIRFAADLLKDKPISSDRLNINLFWILWTGVSLVNISIGWRFSGHYYYMFFPVMAGLFAVLWSDIVLFFINIKQWYKKIPVAISLISSVALMCFSILYPLCAYTGFPPGDKFYITYMEGADPIGRLIKKTAYYITAHTNPSDRLFVWGYCPEIYILSGRRCATRYVHCNFLVGDVDPYRHGPRYDRIKQRHWQELFDDFSNTMPVYIIDISPTDYIKFGSNPINSMPIMKKFLDEHYYIEKRIGQIVLYRLK